MLVFPEGTQGHRQDLRRALPAAPLRPRRLRRDRDARRRAGHPDRGGRRRGVDADPVQEPAARQGCSASRTSRSPPTCSRFGPLLGARSPTSRPSSAPGARRRCTSTSSPTRSATRAAGSWTSPSASAQQIQDALYDMLRAAPQRLVRLSAGHVRVLVTGLGTFWGGRVAQALEADPTSRSSSASTRASPTVAARAHRVRAHRLDLLDPRPHRAGHAGRHDRAHAPRRRLHARCGARTMHEINVIGTMNLLAAARRPGSPVRKVVREVVDARLRRRARGPRTASARRRAARAPPRTAVERSLLEVEGFVRDFADDNPHVNVTLLRFANVLGADIDTPLSQGARAAGRAGDLRLRPPASSSSTRTTSCGRSCSCSTHDVPGVYNVAGDGALPWSEVAAIGGQAHRARCPPFGTSLRRRAAAPARASTCRPSCSTCCATAAASTTAGFKRAGFRLPLHVGRHGRGVRRGAPRSGARSASDRPATATSATSRTSSATPPPSSASRPGLRSDRLVAVRAPVPRLAGQVVEAVAAGVAGQPLEAGAAAGADDAAAVAREVDGQAALVHRRCRVEPSAGGRSSAARCRRRGSRCALRVSTCASDDR